MIVPPIKIQGKKTKLIPEIKSIAETILGDHPEIDTWVEPFLGSGVVAFNCAEISRIRKVIVNDINPHIIKFYMGIASGTITGDRIREVFKEHSKNLKEQGYDYYNEIKDRFNKTFETMDFLFLTRTGFNGVMRFNGKGEWNVPFCKIKERLSDNVIEDLASSVEELYKLFSSKEFVFYNKSFEEVIESAPDNSIFYCDPPYYGLDVKYFKGWGEEDEIRLNGMLKDKNFIYSTWLDNRKKDNPMIEKLWKDYPVQEKEHKYNVAEKASERMGVTEGIFYTGKEQYEKLW